MWNSPFSLHESTVGEVLYPTEKNDGGPLNLIPLGPSSLMCLRLFMLRVTGFSTVEQGNQRLLTKNSTSLTAATA